MQVLERAKGRDDPSGGILDVVARQPYLLSRAGESAQEGHEPGVGRVRCRVPRDSVVGDAESSKHVLRETTSRGQCERVCPSRTNERGDEGYCVKGGGEEVGKRERERAGSSGPQKPGTGSNRFLEKNKPHCSVE